MGRVLTPDGKRVSIGLKVSETKAKAVDAARGGVPRAQWIEAAINAYLALPVTVESPPPEVVEDAIVPPERGADRKRKAAAESSPVEAIRALAEASGVPLVPASELERPAARSPKNCKHPNMRIRKGVCPDCDEWVTAKS
jgi:hypothetical protein